MAQLTAEQTVQAADAVIHDVGTTWMLSEHVAAHAREHGYGKAFPFYFVGRGGVLGDVDAGVVVAAMGYWEPGLLRRMWDRGLAVAGAREGARRYAATCAAWADEHLTGLRDPERLAELAGRVVDAVEVCGLSLFAGWRAEPLPPPGPARVLHLVHVLREWRGSAHVVATTAAGLGPLEAILTNEGADQARYFGWRGDFPDCTHLKDRQQRAQEITNALVTPVYERALTPAERAEYAELVEDLGGLVLR